MRVDIHLLGYLAQYSPTGEEKFKFELPPGATVGQLLEKIHFPEDVEKMVLINGHQAKLSTPLAEGDDVFVFTPAAGG